MTEADCKLVTLAHVLTNGITNDLGFQVRDKLILLVEAQSKFSVNIALRMLLYLAATYKEYVDEQKLNLYGSKPVSIPRPELYMVHTGAPAICRRSCGCPICMTAPAVRRLRSRCCEAWGKGIS